MGTKYDREKNGLLHVTDAMRSRDAGRVAGGCLNRQIEEIPAKSGRLQFRELGGQTHGEETATRLVAVALTDCTKDLKKSVGKMRPNEKNSNM